MSVYIEEYADAVVHELTERERTGSCRPSGLGFRESSPVPVPRSVSVVCRLCHGDLDPDGYCALDGEVTLR
jgi:hypothetical protein